MLVRVFESDSKTKRTISFQGDLRRKQIMKVLNLYAVIGGNRKLWEDVEVTAVENNSKIAEIYQDFFPKDRVIIGDAHKYLLEYMQGKYYYKYDFIWSSPPCPTHSDIRRCGVHGGQYEALYPDMKLYEEIILLKYFAPIETKWIVENVKPYYELLIPAFELDRHLFWSNFFIRTINTNDDRIHSNMVGSTEVYGFNLDKYTVENKRKILRNLVRPELGLHILNESKIDLQPELFRQTK